MTNLPPEILFKVFYDDELDRDDRLECTVVCKAWSSAALRCLNSKLWLGSSNDVDILLNKLRRKDSSIHGNSIRHLSFSRAWNRNLTPINNTVFIFILQSCPNLQVLKIEEGDFSKHYWEYMMQYKSTLRFKSLQHITASTNSNQHLLVNWGYRQTINQLDFFFITERSLQDIPGVNDFYAYVCHFPALRTLAIKSAYNLVYLDKLLLACPQLESLELHHVGISTENEKHSKTLSHFQLKHLTVDVNYVSQDLMRYLYDHAGLLTHLSINNSLGSSVKLVKAFTTPRDIDTLPIRGLKLKDYQFASNELVTTLNNNFRALTRIEFDSCSFDGILAEDGNLTLTFDALRLDCLSIDFESVINQSSSTCSTCLVVKRHDKETVCYQRQSKWSSNNTFNQIETLLPNKLQKKLKSNSVAVITVEAQELNFLRMRLHSGSLKFNQVIALD